MVRVRGLWCGVQDLGFRFRFRVRGLVYRVLDPVLLDVSYMSVTYPLHVN